MKKFLFKTLFATIFLISGIASKLFAYHTQGGEITYTCVSPNTYEIKCKLYQDCAAINILQPTNILDIKALGCNVGRTVIMNKVATNQTGDPYCSLIGNNCGTTIRENHLEAVYTAIISFSAAEAACPNWVLSSTFNSRSVTANLVNTQVDLYIESYLNLNSGINNSSAKINAVGPTVEFVCVGQETKLSFTAYDADCDSLTYELVAPLNAANTLYAYAPITTGAAFIENPNPPLPYCNTCTPRNPQLGYFVGGTPAFSPTYPLPSYNVNWNAIPPGATVPPQIVPVYPYFNFNTSTGELEFKPAVYFPSPPVLGQNKYAVVVKINEWRKINGIMTMVGHTRRDMLFIVENCGGNSNPTIPTIVANGQQIQSNDIITIRPGAPLNLQITTADIDTADKVTFDSNVTTELAGSVFTHSAASKPTAQIAWTAPNTNFFCGIRYFYIRVKDDACPIRGKKVYVIGVKVSNTGIATGIKENLKADLNFIAYPNPFSETVTFKISQQTKPEQQEIWIYNALGQEIDKFQISDGQQTVQWLNAGRFPAGNYIARLIAIGQTPQTIKFTRLN